jgi:hypothetical protein
MSEPLCRVEGIYHSLNCPIFVPLQDPNNADLGLETGFTTTPTIITLMREHPGKNRIGLRDVTPISTPPLG